MIPRLSLPLAPVALALALVFTGCGGGAAPEAPGEAGASEPAPARDVREDALAFRDALVSGDPERMREHYTPIVALLQSELWKPRWGLRSEGAEIPEDQRIGRDRVVHGYERMIEDIERANWTRAFEDLPHEVHEGGGDPADAADGGAPGDVSTAAGITDDTPYLRIDAGSDEFLYFFRLEDDGRWRVFAEVSDY